MVKITDLHSDHEVMVTDNYLMVCLCDMDGVGTVSGPLLNGVEVCGNHASAKLESLVQIGVSCLLFVEVDEEIVPLKIQDKEPE